MNFAFSPEEEAFRAELRRWLAEALPPGWVGPADEADDKDWALTLRLRKQLAERGWLTLAWPAEYGGRDASPMMQIIFAEEMAYHRAPGNDRFGTRMIGPTLIQFGTEEQKRRHLPLIARGEVQWCQGYSEPTSGSDLASLQTRAAPDGDEFVISGRKIWTTLAHRADWIFMLARTNPAESRHRGISFFLVDMRTPGVTVRPIVNLAGMHGFNEITFDDVRVPRQSFVGALDRGWYVGVALLDFERSGIDYVAGARRLLEEFIEYARTGRSPGAEAAWDDPDVRRRLIDLTVEVEAARLNAYEVAFRQSQGENPTTAASISKVTGTIVAQRVADAGVEILGMYGQLEPGSPHAALGGRALSHHQQLIGSTILAGTTEIQKNVIATRGLGLPRA